MKYLVAFLWVLSTTSVYAVEGYDDVYLDREKPIYIHSVFCGKNFNSVAQLKPGVIYSNSEKIEKGTYYFSSVYGNFSYTFNNIPGKDPSQIMARGLLLNGETDKNKMKKEVCLVGPIAGLPSKLLKNLEKRVISANDPEWDVIMERYKLFGKPAFAKGVFKDQRSLAKEEQHDKKIYAANQAHVKELENIFAEKANKLILTIPKKIKTAVQYANQEDGFLDSKVYPVIKEPLVWTAVAKKRYDDQQRALYLEKQWDALIQKNFDWFFNLIEKGDDLVSSEVLKEQPAQWKDKKLHQVVTLKTQFKSGKILLLDFELTSSKVNAPVFDSLQRIHEKSELIRNNPIASSKKPLQAIALPNAKDFDVYSSVDKVNLFFSNFRDKKMGSNYRLQ